MRLGRAAALVALGLTTAACGGGGGRAISVPTVAPAREYALAWESAKTLPKPGTTTVRFAVRTPDGKILSKFRTGPGPHTGVHLIIVRDDLSTIIHLHPPIPASGQLAIPVDLPRAGRYHVLVDVYPAGNSGPRNFQLTRDIQVGKGDAQAPLPAYAPVVHTGGLTFRVTQLPKLKLALPGSMIVDVTDAQGKAVHSSRSTARSRTRSSSAPGRSTTSTRTSAATTPLARPASARRRRPATAPSPASSSSACCCPPAAAGGCSCRCSGRASS